MWYLFSKCTKMSFLNKVAVVTGASSGIGASIAQKLSAQGARVTIVGRNATKLKDISDKCEQSGRKPITIIADVSKDEDGKRMIDETLNSYGKLDVLVNNAGINNVASILSKDALKVFDNVIATNLRSIVNLTNLAAPYLIETKGNIVNISSTASTGVFPITGFAYNTSKAGLDHFSRCVALELAPKGVRVNVVNPGPVKTDIGKNMGLPDDQLDKLWNAMKKATALSRISDPEEVADLVLFLASEQAKSITGATYVVDNGTLLR